jgi:hypothetical protein
MKHCTLVAWILGLLINGAALAADETDRCSRVAQLPTEIWARDCDCGAGIKDKHRITAPAGMRIVAVCGFSVREDGSELGASFFRGSSIVHGLVRYYENHLTGLDVSFFSERWGLFQIDNKHQDATAKALHVPEYSEQNPCWEAEATAKVTQLVVLFGHDTEGDGNWPLDFNFVSVGQFAPCKSFQ